MTDYPLTPEAVERAAAALAESVNGGCWDYYTPEQRALWRARVRHAMRLHAWRGPIPDEEQEP